MRKMWSTSVTGIFLVAHLFLVASITSGFAATKMPADSWQLPAWSANELLIQFKANLRLNSAEFRSRQRATGFAGLDSLNSLFGLREIVSIWPDTLTGYRRAQATTAPLIFLFKFDRTDAAGVAIHAYRKLSIVERVEFNYFYFANPQWSANQADLDQLHLPEAAPFVNHLRPLLIGVIDTGIDGKILRATSDIWTNSLEQADRKDNDHNGLIDDIWGYNFVDQELLQQFGHHWQGKPIDDCGHGTRVTQVISQLANFGAANKPPYFRPQVMILKAGFQLPSGKIVFSIFSLLRAIQYAIDHGANIVHLSCSGSYSSQFLQQAIQRAVSSGCLVVAAAGDDNSNALAYPAALDDVLAVTAIDLDDKKLASANYGNWIDLAAPGFSLPVRTNPPVASNPLAGSATAAAYVSGLAALLISSNDAGPVQAILNNLIWSCDNIYPQNPDLVGQLGAGKIHAGRALQRLYRPNIVVTRIAGYCGQQSEVIPPATPIPITVSLRNMSFAANDLCFRIAVDDSIGSAPISQFCLPELSFLQTGRNRQQPLLLQIDRPWPVGKPLPVTMSIETANGFSLSQAMALTIETAPGISLSLVAEQPVTLKWSADYGFAGYFLYRKESGQPFFEKLNPLPIDDSVYVDYTANKNAEAAYYVVGVDGGGLESLPSDTVKVQAGDNMSSTSLATSLKTDKPKVQAAFFQTDTLLMLGDSLRLYFQIDSSQSDSLRYLWFVNGKILEQHQRPELWLPANLLAPGKNTIEVTITARDTTINHRWTVRLQQRPITISTFSPGPDTTIYEGDSLRLAIKLTGSGTLPTAIHWQCKGQVDTTHTGLTYWLQPDYSAAGNDSIVVRFVIGDSVYSHCWRIQILNRNRPPIISSHALMPQTSHSLNETLRLWIQAQDPDGDSLSFRWYFNQRLDSTQVDSFFVFHGLRSPLTSDTILVRIADRDTAITHFWLLPMWHKNQPPQIINCTPLPTTKLAPADSIRFQVLCQDADNDSLSFAWFLNGQLDSSAQQPTYLYRSSPDSLQNDTITVAIADGDTTITCEWIIVAVAEPVAIATQAQFTWFPVEHSISASSDSIILGVSHIPSEAKIQWAINDSLVATSTDSVFIHRRASAMSHIDTISAMISLPDRVAGHVWIVQFLPLSNQNNWKLTFQPNSNVLHRSPDDSIRFSVNISGDRLPALFFRWQVNGQSSDLAQDSLFWYRRQPNIANQPDTIMLQISAADTTIIHQWVVIPDSVRVLPSPRLIFPVNAEFISDDDKLIWQNDSLLTAPPAAEPWQYVVQIAADSNFSRIISSDTCSASSLRLNRCANFEKLPVDKALYWRAKLFAANHYRSDFQKSNRPFFFYPQFSQVENLMITIQEDGSIELSWSSFQDKNCAGFNLYRSQSPQTNFVKLNDQLIIGKTNFSFRDLTAQAGVTYNYKLEEVSQTGKKKVQRMTTVTAPKPDRYSLTSNFPNPFNSLTSFKYEIPAATYVTIEVYNVLGKKVKTLVDAFKEPGIYTVFWDGRDDAGQNVVSGVYFYHMATANYNMTHKMIVVR